MIPLRVTCIVFKSYSLFDVIEMLRFNKKTRKSAVRVTTSNATPRICAFWYLLKVNRTICSGVVTKNDFGVFASLTLIFDLLTFDMRLGDKGTAEEYVGFFVGPS